MLYLNELSFEEVYQMYLELQQDHDGIEEMYNQVRVHLMNMLNITQQELDSLELPDDE